MGRKIKIALPAPCHEDWDKMTPSGRGRHCAACQKVVIDCTQMNDTQLIDLFGQAKGHSLCGRFQSHQLDRPLVDARPRPSFITTIGKRIAATLLLFQSAASMAQQTLKDNIVEQTDSTKKQANSTSQITAHVFDTSHIPVAYAQVHIREIDSTFVANASGEFTFHISNAIRQVSALVQLHGTDTAAGTPPATYEVTGVIDASLSVNLFLATGQPISITFLQNPYPIISSGGTAIQQPIIADWYKNICYTVTAFTKRVPTSVAPKMPQVKTTATLWGKLTSYWMGNKPSGK